MIKIIQTEHWINQAVTKNFALGCKSQIINVNKYFYDKNDIIATYGILRGTGEILQKATKYYGALGVHFHQPAREAEVQSDL